MGVETETDTEFQSVAIDESTNRSRVSDETTTSSPRTAADYNPTTDYNDVVKQSVAIIDKEVGGLLMDDLVNDFGLDPKELPQNRRESFVDPGEAVEELVANSPMSPRMHRDTIVEDEEIQAEMELLSHDPTTSPREGGDALL